MGRAASSTGPAFAKQATARQAGTSTEPLEGWPLNLLAVDSVDSPLPLGSPKERRPAHVNQVRPSRVHSLQTVPPKGEGPSTLSLEMAKIGLQVDLLLHLIFLRLAGPSMSLTLQSARLRSFPSIRLRSVSAQLLALLSIPLLSL